MDDDSQANASALPATIASAGIPADAVVDSLRWVELGTTQSDEELAGLDAVHVAEASSELGALWGDRYAENVGAINAFLNETFAPDVADAIRHARRTSGRALFNDPAIAQRILGLALAPRPQSTSTGDVDSQIRQIEAFIRSNRADYSRNEPLQARYRQLLGQRLQSAQGVR